MHLVCDHSFVWPRDGAYFNIVEHVAKGVLQTAPLLEGIVIAVVQLAVQMNNKHDAGAHMDPSQVDLRGRMRQSTYRTDHLPR